MPEKGILLSRLEQEMLVNPETLNARQKRNLNYRLKTRSNQIDQVLQELKLLIDNVPEDSIKKSISNTTLDSLMTILEKFLQIRDPWPIGVHKDEDRAMAFRVFGNATPSSIPGKCVIFSISHTPTYDEMELDHRLTNHFNRIRCYIDPCIPDPICRNPEYIGVLSEKIFKIGKVRKELDKPFSINENAYIDVAGISKHGWLLKEPVQIDIDQLPWMQWIPRELKECLEQPPILKEKKLPVQWTSLPSIDSMSTPEENEEFRKWVQKKNEMEIDEKDLSEINAMIKKIPRSEEEYNDEERKALKEKLDSMQWKHVSAKKSVEGQEEK